MTCPPLTIRGYRNDDHDGLAALYGLAFPDDPPWNKPGDMIASKIAFDRDGLRVGLIGGQVVASVMAGYDGHRGWINALAVHPDHRGQGYGAAIMSHAVAFLTERGAVKINLQIRGDNHRLQRYYESLGFETEDRLSMGLLTSLGKDYR
ncbi:MAG: GNAT family acetyltransferase [Alphaproteobacteria bacterium]|nr:GNAT family acetyltransferase [Alphaproteobacteria bacterium]